MNWRQQFVTTWHGLEREAWLRFLLALAGLAAAFALALFSSAARQSGDAAISITCAALALLLSATVALTTVPYLARRVSARRLGEAFSYEVTREGLAYLALTLLISVAALNTGNNLLFIVVSAMLAAILVSGVVSARMLNGLEVSLHLPRHVFAGRVCLAAVHLHNRRRLPAFSITVVPPLEEQRYWRWQRTTFMFPSAASGHRPILRWPDYTLRRVVRPPATPSALQESVYFAYLPGRQRLSTELELCFARRGVYAQRALGLTTRFPFSFLSKTRLIDLPDQLLVFPSIEPTDEALEVLPAITGEIEASQPGRGSDLYRIRDYQPEDSTRHVDWKATARSGELKVREYSREDERRIAVVFDNPAPGALSPQAYERAVTTAASIAWHFFEQRTELTFFAPELTPGGEIYGFLAYLAQVAPARHAADWLEQLPQHGQYNIILTTAPQGSLPGALWRCSWVVFLREEPSTV